MIDLRVDASDLVSWLRLAMLVVFILFLLFADVIKRLIDMGYGYPLTSCVPRTHIHSLDALQNLITCDRQATDQTRRDNEARRDQERQDQERQDQERQDQERQTRSGESRRSESRRSATRRGATEIPQSMGLGDYWGCKHRSENRDHGSKF